MSHGKRFSASKLEQLGFHQTSEGQWSKDSIQDDNPQSQASKSQSDECSSKVAEEKDKGSGEGCLRYRLIVHSYRTHFIDPSNASVKQIEDCLTPTQGRKDYGIGIIPDDSPLYCDQPLFLQTKVKKGFERTEIEMLSYYVDEE